MKELLKGNAETDLCLNGEIGQKRITIKKMIHDELEFLLISLKIDGFKLKSHRRPIALAIDLKQDLV